MGDTLVDVAPHSPLHSYPELFSPFFTSFQRHYSFIFLEHWKAVPGSGPSCALGPEQSSMLSPSPHISTASSFCNPGLSINVTSTLSPL